MPMTMRSVSPLLTAGFLLPCLTSMQALSLWMKNVEEELAASKTLVEEMQSNFA